MEKQYIEKIMFSIKDKKVYFCRPDNDTSIISSKKIGSGGTANVYKVPAGTFQIPIAIKRYSDKILEKDGAAIGSYLRALIEFRKNVPDDTRRVIDNFTIWPQCLVYDYVNGKVCGFTMQLIPDLFFTKIKIAEEYETKESNLDFVLHGSDFRQKHGLLSVSSKGRAKIIYDFIQIVSVLHNHDYVLGDLSPQNILIAVDEHDQSKNKILFIDTDSYRKKGSIHPLKQLHTPDWIPPECQKASDELNKLTPNANPNLIARLEVDMFIQNQHTDIYKVCLAITRLYHKGDNASIITCSDSADKKLREELGEEFADFVLQGLSQKPDERPDINVMLACFKNAMHVKAEERDELIGKFDLIVLLLDKHSPLFDSSGKKLSVFKQKYALAHATLTVIYIGEKANRIISGQQIAGIDILPYFDDSEGRNDAVAAIQSWMYEAQANMFSGSAVKLRTAIFVDSYDYLLNAHRIEPAVILAGFEETEYLQLNRHTGNYEPIKVSKIAKLEVLAKNGDAKALYELGLAYLAGEGVKKDQSRAQFLLYKSYLRGNIEAIFALVDLFDEPAEHFRKEAAKHR